MSDIVSYPWSILSILAVQRFLMIFEMYVAIVLSSAIAVNPAIYSLIWLTNFTTPKLFVTLKSFLE